MAATTKFSMAVFWLACLLPFIVIVNLGSDVQPNALVFSLVAASFLIWESDAPKEIWILAIMAVVALFAASTVRIDILALRNIATYISMFSVSFVAYIFLKKDRSLFILCLEAAFHLWVFSGVIQFFTGPFVFEMLVPLSRTSIDRGMPGLSGEPSFYGLMMLMFLVIFRLLGVLRIRHAVLALGTILFVAQSSVAVLVLALAAGVYGVMSINNLKRFTILAVTVSIVAVVILQLPSDMRIARLFSLFLQAPEQILLTDASVSERFVSIFVPLYAFVSSYGLPHGLETSAWFEAFRATKREFPLLFWYSVPGTRIMSGYGKVLFEFGLLGLIYPLLFTWAIWMNRDISTAERLWLVAIVNLIALNAMPLTHPGFSVIFAVALYRYYGSDQRMRSVPFDLYRQAPG